MAFKFPMEHIGLALTVGCVTQNGCDIEDDQSRPHERIPAHPRELEISHIDGNMLDTADMKMLKSICR